MITSKQWSCQFYYLDAPHGRWLSKWKKKLDRNCTRIWALLNKSRKQHPRKQQLYGYLPPISKTIQMRLTRHVRHCWRSRNELISDFLIWTPSHRCASVGWLIRTYLQQLCMDTGCCLEDLPEVLDDRDNWREGECQGNMC